MDSGKIRKYNDVKRTYVVYCTWTGRPEDKCDCWYCYANVLSDMEYFRVSKEISMLMREDK